VLGHPLLRPLVGATALFSFWNSALEAVWLLYLTRELGLAPGLLGVVLAVGNTGFLLGAVGIRRAAARLGVGPTLIGGLAAAAPADLAAPLVGFLPHPAGSPMPIAGPLMAAQVVFGLGVIAFNVGSASLLQGAAPDGVRARMAGATEFLTGSVTPLGALAGGAGGAAIGLQATLFVAVAGELSAALWLLSSPLRGVRAVPSSGDDR
jgi:hypothetical protein